MTAQICFKDKNVLFNHLEWNMRESLNFPPVWAASYSAVLENFFFIDVQYFLRELTIFLFVLIFTY